MNKMKGSETRRKQRPAVPSETILYVGCIRPYMPCDDDDDDDGGGGGGGGGHHSFERSC